MKEIHWDFPKSRSNSHVNPPVKELHWDFPKSRKGSLKNVIIPHSNQWPLKQKELHWDLPISQELP